MRDVEPLGEELVTSPKHGLKDGQAFETKVVYSGTPVEFVLPGIDLRDRLHAPTTASPWLGSPRSPPRGSPSTTTRGTRRPTPT